jgi:hypothetical protein
MAPKKSNKLPTGEKPKQLSAMAKRVMRETNSPSEAASVAGTYRDRLARQKNTKVGGTGARTSYSPEPMSIKKKLAIRVQEGRKAAMTPKQKKAAAELAKKATYSPAPMSAAAKAKAAAAGAASRKASDARKAAAKNPMGLKKMNLDTKAKKK